MSYCDIHIRIHISILIETDIRIHIRILIETGIRIANYVHMTDIRIYIRIRVPEIRHR